MEREVSVYKDGLLLKKENKWKWYRVTVSQKSTLIFIQSKEDPSETRCLDLTSYSIHPSSVKHREFGFSLFPKKGGGLVEKFCAIEREDYLSWIKIISIYSPPVTKYTSTSQEDLNPYIKQSPSFSLSQSENSVIDIRKDKKNYLWNHISPRTKHLSKRKKTMGNRKTSLQNKKKFLNDKPRTKTEPRKNSNLKRKDKKIERDNSLLALEKQLENIPGSDSNYNDLFKDQNDIIMTTQLNEYPQVVLSLNEEELLARTNNDSRSRSVSHSIINTIIDEIVEDKNNDRGWVTPDRAPAGEIVPITPSAVHRQMSPSQIENLIIVEEEKYLVKLKKKYITPGDPRKKYTVTTQNIGKGSVGEVFFAYKGDKKVAIKILELIRRGRDRLPLILREIEIIATSGHPNIVEYIETFDMSEELWVVMEYMSNGSLYDIVKLYQAGVQFTEEQTSYCIKQVLEALAYLHQKSRIHRDIKVDNILLDKDGAVKLADFGTAVQLTFQRLQRNTLAGTPYYMAPELIQRIPYKEKVDIWSVGITILELMTGRPPFYHLEPEEALQAILKHGVKGLPNDFSEDIRDFTNRCCLTHDPSLRYSAKELLKHTFIQRSCTKLHFAQMLSDISKLHSSQSDETPARACTIL